MGNTVLPLWEDCAEKDKVGGTLTPIEQFVFEYEPGGMVEETSWRYLLAAVLLEARRG